MRYEEQARGSRAGWRKPVGTSDRGSDNVGPIPYVQLQTALDGVFLRGRRYYWKLHFLREITDTAIDILLQAYSTAPSALSVAVLQQVGGAIPRIPVSATAYGNRDAGYDFFPIAIWEDPDRDEVSMRWVRELWTAMRPFSTGGVYVNNLGDEGEDRIRAAYGVNYQRLVALKSKYDPKDYFRTNQNIRPKL